MVMFRMPHRKKMFPGFQDGFRMVSSWLLIVKVRMNRTKLLLMNYMNLLWLFPKNMR